MSVHTDLLKYITEDKWNEFCGELGKVQNSERLHVLIHAEKDMLVRRACQLGRFDMFRVLHSLGANIRINDKECSKLAAGGGHTRLAVLLAQMGVVHTQAISAARYFKKRDTVAALEKAIAAAPLSLAAIDSIYEPVPPIKADIETRVAARSITDAPAKPGQRNTNPRKKPPRGKEPGVI